MPFVSTSENTSARYMAPSETCAVTAARIVGVAKKGVERACEKRAQSCLAPYAAPSSHGCELR